MGLHDQTTIGIDPDRHGEDDATEEVGRPVPVDPMDVWVRYEDLGTIGSGGVGEVHRVRDRTLDRTLAMKILKVRFAKRSRTILRFVEEARATAQLQHPGIVPVHDMGTLADGRVWFTMKEVRGRTLADVIDELHATSESERPAALRSLMSAYLTVCETMAYAHERGVLHRDLKPENIMVGNRGELYVLDWGLAKITQNALDDLDDVDEDLDDAPIRSGRAFETLMGQVAGTPAYMAPEQAHGHVDAIDARTDVYALGAVLYEILSGRPPYEGDARSVVERVRVEPPAPLRPDTHSTFGIDSDDWIETSALPPALVEICERAMARDPAQRFPMAQALAESVRAWLDGSRLREQALALVTRAEDLEVEADALEQQARTLQRRSEQLLAEIPVWATEEEKAEAWSLADRAAQLTIDAGLRNVEVDETLGRALQILPNLPEAHAARTRRRFAAHRAAEAAQKPRERIEALLRRSAKALPKGHELRREVATYLRGDGALTLITDPPGAEVEFYRLVRQNRRLVEVPMGSLGHTPLRAEPLAMGSYVAVLRHPDCMPVRYPFTIDRCGHWMDVPPDSTEPHPVWLPPVGYFAADELYVPAGWFRAGGDPHPAHPPGVRLWCDGLAIQRFPVTNIDYIEFLDDLVAQGRVEEALALAPREMASKEPDAQILYAFDGTHFSVMVDADGDAWLPDEPVTYVSWFDAQAYLAWLGERTGRPWRLPGELEWEKSARGVDGRLYPWGDDFDPSWARIYQSARGRAEGDYGPVSVNDHPTDCSVYGARGMAGNTSEWCQEPFANTLPMRGQRVVVESQPLDSLEPSNSTRLSSVRGGAWTMAASQARCTYRHRSEMQRRHSFRGFRGVFTVTKDSIVR